MHRPAAAKGNHAAPVIGFARLDGVHPRRVGHVLIDHFNHAQPRHLRRKAEPGADLRLQRRQRRRRLQRHRAAGKPRRVIPPQRQIGIRHRRHHPAAPITRRPRIGPGTLRPNPDPPETIHMRDRAAPGADLHHLNHRYPQRQPGPFAKPAHPRHFKRARRLRLEIVDQADLRRRAAHIERQHIVQPAFARNLGGENRPARRPAFHQPDRETARGFNRRQPATGQHQKHRRLQPDRRQFLRQPPQIARHQRLHIRIGHRGGKPLPLAHFRRHV